MCSRACEADGASSLDVVFLEDVPGCVRLGLVLGLLDGDAGR